MNAHANRFDAFTRVEVVTMIAALAGWIIDHGTPTATRLFNDATASLVRRTEEASS